MWKLILSAVTPAIIIFIFKKKIKMPEEKIPTFKGKLFFHFKINI